MMADPIRLSSSTAMAVAVVTLTLAIWAEWGRAATLEVSNQRILPENYLYVWCFDGLKRENPQLIPPKKMVQIPVRGGGNKDAGNQLLPYLCTGSYTKFYGMGALPYYIYSSRSSGGDASSSYRVMANETSFYRWNLEKRVWDVIPPSPWIH